MDIRAASGMACGLASLSSATTPRCAPLRAVLLASTALVFAAMVPVAAQAQDATWLTNPGSGDFFDANNWSPNSVPTGTATFGASSATTLTLGNSGTFDGWTFAAGAPGYTLNISVGAAQDFIGGGITINGGGATIVNSGLLKFSNASTAGSATIGNSLILEFYGSSTAGNATIANNAVLAFYGTSTVDSAYIFNNGDIQFRDASSAGTATIDSFGSMQFRGSSTAGSATINGGMVYFYGNSTAGSAAITVDAHMELGIFQNSTADSATIINNGTFDFRDAGSAGSATITNNNALRFFGASTAGSASVTNNGALSFLETSTAGSATINNASSMLFRDSSTAGSATITNSSFLNFLDSGTASGATIASSGTMDFSGGSTAGTATITNTGFAQFLDTSTAGNAAITNSGGLNFYDTSSAGSATITNNGALTFQDRSTAGHAALINNVTGLVDFSGGIGPGGDNRVTAGSIAGAGGYFLGDKELTVGSNSLSTEVSGVISGTGSLVKTGMGTLTLTGANTYSGGTTISGGTVQVGNGSAAGSILGGVTVDGVGMLDIVNDGVGGITAITNNGSTFFRNTSSAGSASITNDSNLLFFDASTAGNATITNTDDMIFLNTSTAGTATITNFGGLDFLNASTAGSATIHNNNMLNFSGYSTAGNAHIANILSLNFDDIATAGSATISNHDTLNFDASSTAGAASIDNYGFQTFYQISTASSASINNHNELRFRDISTADTATISNLGDLYFDDASTVGDATITNYGNLWFNDISTAGSATLVNNTGGMIDFSGSTGPHGDGRLSAGSIAGAGNYLLGANELTVGSNNLSTEVSGVISGTGSLVKVGTGTLTLSGINTYTGSTRVLGGLLKATGTLAGTIDISAGGKVGGNGTLGTVNVGNGGILSPGNSIGAVTIATLSTGAGAFYDVELIDGGNTPGVHNDLINVTGLATINPGLTIRVMPENGTDNGYSYMPGTVYTVLTTTAPGDLLVNGAPDITDSFAFLNFAGSHDTQNFYLTSQLAATTFCQTGLGANQCGAGDAAFALGSGNGVFDAMLGLGQDDVAAALASISGEAHASVQSVIDQTFAQLGQSLTSRGSAGVAALNAAMQPLGYVAPPSSASVAAIDGAMLSPAAASAWLTPLGGRGHVAADANAMALDWWHGGLAGGYEITSENALAGLAFGYQRGSASVAARQSQTALDSFMLGTYGALTDGANTLAGALTLGTSHVSTDRTVTVGGLTNQAHAEYWTQSIGLSLEASHDLELGNGMTLTPLATLGLGWSGHGGFTETGAGAFNLTAAAKGTIYLDAGIGLGLSQVIETDDGALTLSARAAWEHGFAGTSSQSMTFAGGATPFTIEGPSAGSDRLRLGAGISFEAHDGLMMGLDYDGSLSASEQAHKASASIGVQF